MAERLYNHWVKIDKEKAIKQVKDVLNKKVWKNLNLVLFEIKLQAKLQPLVKKIEVVASDSKTSQTSEQKVKVIVVLKKIF